MAVPVRKKLPLTSEIVFDEDSKMHTNDLNVSSLVVGVDWHHRSPSSIMSTSTSIVVVQPGVLVVEVFIKGDVEVR